MRYGQQACLIAEYDDLKQKIDKLETFMQSDTFKSLQEDERIDLSEQLTHMQNYLKILWKRLNRKGLI